MLSTWVLLVVVMVMVMIHRPFGGSIIHTYAHSPAVHHRRYDVYGFHMLHFQAVTGRKLHSLLAPRRIAQDRVSRSKRKGRTDGLSNALSR
jgi:hypothetical protein